MKKIRLSFCVFFLLFMSFSAKLAAQGNCPWHVQIDVLEATCLNNGGVQFYLLTDNGDVIDIDIDNKKPYDAGINLSEIKFYHQSLTNLEDTVTYYSTNPRLFLTPGTYRVGVQAQCYNGGDGSGAYTPLSYEQTIEVVGSYTVPTVSILANIASSSWACGNRPTVPGDSTGRIQLRISGGSLPYTIVLVNSDNQDTVETRTVTRAENNGTNPNAANYREYFTFDNLPAASYRFYFADACDFRDTATSLSWTVEDAQAPMLLGADFHATSTRYTNYGTIYSDSNVVEFYNVHLSEGDLTDYLYNDYAQHVQYRVCYGTADTSDWKAFPMNNLQKLNDKSYNLNNYLYDTAQHLGSYCEFLGQNLTLQYRNTLPGQEDIISLYTAPIENRINRNHRYAEDVNYTGTWYDSCTFHIPGVHQYTNYYYYYQTNCSGYDLTQTPETYPWTCVSFYTYPIYYEIIDNNDNTIVADAIIENGNNWNVTKAMFEDHFGPISATMVFPATVRITDAKGCVYSRTENIMIYNEIDTLDGNSHMYYYNHHYDLNEEAAHCCQSLKGFYITERFSSESENTHLPNPIPQRFKQTRDGAQFQLIKSPRNNKYNFTATYHFDTDEWEIVRADMTNTAEITPKLIESSTEYQWGLSVNDYCLPYGYYDFLYITDCDTQSRRVYYTSTPSYEYRYEYTLPSYTSYQECDNYFITMQTGEYRRLQIGSDTEDPLQPEKVMSETVLNTYFKIINGPQGGYPTDDFRVGSTIRLTVPGTYTLRMYTPDTSVYCRAPYYDTTITYIGGTVSFNYAYAYVCDADSTVGFFYCQAMDGMAPYHYSLYALTNMEGGLLEENNTGSFKGLSNIHVGDMMSLGVGDACGRSYYVNITVTDLSSSRLAWFDGALRVTETCEGSEIDVYVSSVDEDFTYHWTGPNGFEANTPRGHILIERGSAAGDYTVELGNTGCSQTLKDTVTLGILPAPQVEMRIDRTSVCPGEEVTIEFTPIDGSGLVSYVIGREINSTDTFYRFSGHVGDMASLTYTAESEATFWIHEVKDGLCNYTIPEDTVKIRLRDAASACDVHVDSVQVCFGATAGLVATSTTMQKPYTIRWYTDAYQQELVQTDVISDGMPDATFTTGRLYADTALYVTIQDATHCETYTGTIHHWMNMADGTTELSCGQSIRLFDDGGSNGNYTPNKYYKHTFTSTDDNLITLSFNSFNTQQNGDVLQVYTGDDVIQDSLLALFSGNSLPQSITSHSKNMTIVFVSNGYIEAAGWDALVSCSALPAKAKIKVLDDLSVSLSISPELPIRHGQDVTLTATANGGQGARYEYTWHILDSQFNEETYTREVASNTDVYTLNNLTETKMVWVVVKDKSANPCTVEDKASNFINIEISKIALTLDLSSPVTEICQGDIPMVLTVENGGVEAARNVEVKLHLPEGMTFANEEDSLILFTEVAANGIVEDTLFVHNEIHVTVTTNVDVKAQIWSCDQGDLQSNWHSWDWTGSPAENDEDMYTLAVRPSLDAVEAPGLTVNSANICYGGDATIQAQVQSGMAYPLLITWYADAALTEVIQTDPLQDNSTSVVSHDFSNIIHEGTLCYVTAENSTYCPAYTTVDYTTKLQYTPTDTVLMHNGSSMVGNNDHVLFFDDGGADGYYSANCRYNYMFTSVDGSPVTIYFDNDENQNYINNNNNNGKIEIYDGESDMTPRLAMYRNSEMRGKVLVANSGKMLVKFSSGDYTERGFSAHVFTSTRAVVAEANVTFKTPLAINQITTKDSTVCYGEGVLLTASSTIDFPQYYSWYDENLQWITNDTVREADSERYSSLEINVLTRSSNYYVTLSNATECPVMVPTANDTYTEQEIRLDAIHDGQVTSITPYDIINFYDEGGRDGSFTTYGYKHTFKTMQGVLQVSFKNSHLSIGTDTLYLYDGEDEAAPLLKKWVGNNIYEYSTYTSTGNSLTFKLYGKNQCCHTGWRIQVRSANPESSMAVAKAGVKAGVPESITTEREVAVCFGSETELSASSSLTTYPQYFVWYNADRNEILHRDTVENPGESSIFRDTPNSETFYYVTVTNSDNCPINESQLPQDTNNLVKIKVTFSEPVISNNVTVNDDVVCYGQNASLTATTNDGTAKHIYWYDEYFNLINDEIGTTGTIEPPVAGNAVYFVNAVETTQCGILPPGYGKFFFDASKDGETTSLVTGEMIPFYDAGGPNDNYNTPGADWTHTFVAPAGKQVTLRMKSFHTSGHVLFVYDGTQNDYYTYRTFNGQYGNTDETFTTTRGRLTLRWVIQNNVDNFNYPGWEGEIGVLDAHNEMHTRNTELATAHVSVKSITDQLASITTTGATVCYGSEALLTASSTIDYPQTFYWFNSRRDSILRQHTIDAGCDTLTVRPTAEGNYYVYVTNSNNCPLPEPVHDNHRVLLFNRQEAHNKTLADNDIIEIYDDGGLSGDFSDCLSDYYNFTAPQGSRIRIHFNNIQLGSNNNYLRLYMRKSDNNYEDKYIYGTLSDTDFVSESNYVQISFQNNCDGVTAAGWDGYLYAVTPINAENLVAANVNFTEPTFSQNVTTSDVESCYGNTVTLTASNIGINSRYAWFDENYNLIKDTVGQYGTLDITALNNTIYYVNASVANGCPVIPPYYGAFRFDASKNNGITDLTTGESMLFFDEGDPDNNYNTPNADWIHTFRAPAGKQVTLLLNSFNTGSGHSLYIYDGTQNENSNHWGYSGNYGNMNYTFTSSNGVLTVRWYIENNANANNFTFPGWEGEVGVKDNNTMTLAHPNLAASHISIKAPLAASEITTVDAEGCYGASATLQASATNNTLGYPQIFYWYDENQGFLGCDTVNSGETSEWTITNLTTSAPYYVTMSNATECPVEMTSKLLLNSTTTGQTTTLNDHYSVRFYDEGGDNRSYENRGGSLTHSFVSENGAVYLTFEDYINICSNDTLYIYNGNSAENGQLLAIYTQGNNTLPQPIVYTSAQGAITVKFSQHYNGGCNGWKAIASTQPISETSPTVLLNAANNGHSTLVVPNETVNFYDEGGNNNSYRPNADYTHTFKALQGNVNIKFSGCSYFCSNDTLYVYDGENVNGTLLGMVGDWVGCSNPTMVSTGSAITVRFKGSDCTSSGWRAQTTTVNPQTAMAQVNATIKAPLSPDTIQTQDFTDCYGSNGYLTATTPGLTGEQTYKWYGPDLMKPIYSETVPEGGMSRLPVHVLRNETYYVTVSNAENCAVTETIHNNYREILMGSGISQVDMAASDSICLFDRGGKNGNCTANGSADSHDFYGPTEDSRIILHINSLNASPDNGQLQISLYDADGNYTTKYLYTSNGIFSDTDFVSMGNRMYVYFYPGSDGQEYPGLDAYLYTIVPHDTNELASATVTVKAPIDAGEITTVDAEACYGASATLQASATNNTLDYPQIFYWYDENQGFLGCDTVNSGETSEWTITNLTTSAPYYVTMSNATECPVEMTSKLLLNSTTTGQTTTLNDHYSVRFYDEGGDNRSYENRGGSLTHSFVSENGAVYLTFEDYINICSNDTLYIYNGNSAENGQLLAIYTQGYNTLSQPVVYTSAQGAITVKFSQHYNGGCNGWKAIASTQPTPETSPTVLLNAVNNGHNTLVVPNETLNFYDEGGRNNYYQPNADYTHTFKVLQGNVSIHFINCVSFCTDDTLYIYDGENVNGTLLGVVGSWTGCSNPTMVSTGSDMTVRFKGSSCVSSGWQAQITAVNPQTSMAEATATIKAPLSPDTIQTQDFTDCYGRNGYLTATTPGLTGDQTYKWYGPDLMEPIYSETVPEGGMSRLPVRVLRNETYYVTVSNAENCAVVETVHNNYREVLMGSGNYQVDLAASDSVCLFDKGGKNDNCIADGNGYSHNFYGPTEDYRIILHINSLNASPDGGQLQINLYDANGNYTTKYLYTSNGVVSDTEFVSMGNNMYVYFYPGSDGQEYPGLDAYIYAIVPHDTNELAPATVSIKTLSPNLINAPSHEICYGSDVELWATSTIGTDQHFVWFEPDRITRHTETVHTIGERSTYTVPSPQQECTYYVAVYNDTTCPLTEPVYDDERVVLFERNSNGEYDLTENMLYRIYDDGGPNGSYDNSGNLYTYRYFNSPQNSYLKVHFDAIDLADDARLYIRRTDTWREVFKLQGPVHISDTDIVIDYRRIEIRIENYSNNTDDGFAGSVCALSPQPTRDLFPVPITFTVPEIASTVTVSDTLACYGTPVQLEASIPGSNSTMHYSWYDENLNLMYEEEGSSSIYTRLATANERFYVNAVNAGQCAVLPPDYSAILLNASTNGGTYTLSEGEAISFYDEGGSQGNYSTLIDWNNRWKYTFKAPDGKQVYMKVNSYHTWNAWLCIYDETSNGNTGRYPNGGETVQIFTSTEGVLSVSWYCSQISANANQSGWDILVYVPDDNNEANQSYGGMQYGTVSVIPFVNTDRINTTSDNICFGSEASLTASASSSDAAFPQIYTWYSPDRMEILQKDTIYAGESQYVFTPTQEATYYVALSGSGECPVVETIHDRYVDDVLFTNQNGGYSGDNTTRLTENNIVRIYDDGGPNGNYTASGEYVYSNKYFETNIPNSKIKVHFDTIALADRHTEFRIRNNQTDSYVLRMRGPVYVSDTDIVIESTRIEIYFRNENSTSSDVGFAGYVHAITPHNNAELAEATVTFTHPTINTSISVNDGEACFGDEVELVATSTGISSPQIFAWFDADYNLVKLDTVTGGQSTFAPQVLGDATYYVNVSEIGDCPVLPPGYVGQVVQPGEINLKFAHVSVKQPTMGMKLLVSNATVCYGSEAILTAHTDAATQTLLGYPHYITWYAPDGRTILFKDTIDGVNKTQSEFSAPYYYQYQDQNYYVSVGNGVNCPVLIAPTNNIYTVLLNDQTHGLTTMLSSADAVKFFDAGGENGNYHNGNSDYTHTFQTIQGNLQVRFSAMDKGGIEEGDTLYIYDAATADNNAVIGKVSYMEDEDDYGTLSFVSTGKYLTFRFESATSSNDEGWSAFIMPVNQQSEMDTAKVFIQVTSVPEAALTIMSDTVCMGQEAEVSASANISYPQYYVWYNNNMEELKRDTIHNASESPSKLSLPAHYRNASYYTLVYSDTVSCLILNSNNLPKAYTELPITAVSSGMETQVSPSDSIRIYTPETIIRGSSDNYDFDYYFTAESGLIQIYFNELEMSGGEIELEFINDDLDLEYAEFDDGIYHNVTVTSMSNRMHMQFSRKTGNAFSFDAIVTNINAINNGVLSKMAQADVTVNVGSATANVNTTNDTVCYGSPAFLTASSSDPIYPQIYTWYNMDVSEVVLCDTIYSGASSLYIPGQMGAYTYYVLMNNETHPCPLANIDKHDNFREYLFTEDMNNATLHIGAIDSLVLYDDGGKDGNYSVVIDDNTHINIMKLQVDPGSTIHVEIPTLETDQNYSFFAIAEPDANGNLQMESENDAIMIRGQISDFSYNSLTNILYVGWVYYGSDRTQQLPGFEAVFTAEMHPESQLTGAKVVMKNLPMMNTLALAASPTDTTICQGDAVELSATSTLADEPQYFVWYNSDFSKVLAADTVQSGNTGYATLENLTQDTLVYVAVGTDDVCPAYPIDFKYNVQEFYLTEAVSGNTMMLSDVDSVLFYDEGGPNESYESTNVMWYQTFKASDPNAKVTIHFSYIDLDTKYDNNWLVVVQGPLDFSNYSNNSFLHDPFEGSSSDVTMTSDVDNLTVVWNSNDWDSKHKGWAAEVYTNQSVTASTDALDSTFVKVNPSYHYTIYDSVCASATIYNVDRFLGIDISVPGDYTIDSVYQTALGCDSIYSLQLHVMGNPHIATPAVTNVNCYHGTDGAIIVTENDVEYGTAPFTFALSKESVPVQDFNTLSAGNYVLSVSDKYGCHSDTILVLTEPDTLQFLSCPTGGEYQTVLGQTYAEINLIAPDYAPVGNNASVETSGVEATNHYDVGVHTITYVVTNSCHESDTCRFTITVVPSTQPISITSSTNSWPFDGEWHQGTYEVTYGGVALTAETGSEGLIFTIPVSNDTLTIVRDASAKVRDYTPTPVPNLFSYNLQNSDHYSQPTLDTGSLEITKNTTTPVTVTVTGHSNSTFFDSNEHTVTGFDLSSDNALFDLSSVRFNGTVADSTASRTAVDTTYMTMDETMFSTEDVNFAFVNFVVHNGYQAITPNTTTDIIVTVKEHGGVVTYDGYEHHVSGFDLVSISSSVYTAEYFHYEGAVDDSIVRGRYVGSYQMNVDSNSFVNDNINYSNVRFVVLNDSLVITPNPTSITITANSAAKLYDGTPLVDSGYSYIPNDVFAMGDTLIVEISGSITEVGEVENKVVDYKVYRNESHNSSMIKSISVPTGYTKDVTDCYTFSLPVSGVLSVVDTLKVSSVVTSGQMCPGENDGTATITVVGGKEKTPDRYEYSIEGSNTGYNNTGHTEGEILLYSLSVDKYVVTVTDDLGFTATDTFNIVERPVITATTQFDCPADIDTVITHGGCNIVLNLGTPNFVAPTGLDMADVTIYNNAPADSVFDVGELTVTWVAKGLCGDSVTCEQHVKVSFQTCPDAVDREGNTYPSVRLGSGCKCWTTENLKSTLYSDGRPIEDVMDYYSSEFPNTTQNVSIFGHLYNWYAAADTLRYGSVDSVENAYRSGNRIQGICPENWYLPSDEDYEELNIYPTTDLRSTSYWVNVTGVVNTNATGFNSLPGGMYNCSTGRFEQMSGESYYWTCHPVYDMATGALIDYICEKIRYSNSSRCNGYSIRCVYDEH